MIGVPKQKREIDKDYRKSINNDPCIISGQEAEDHHTVSVGSGGSDYYIVRLNRPLHTECHTVGKNTFQRKHRIDFRDYIIKSLIRYIKELKKRS
jgi:hypothetical protein